VGASSLVYAFLVLRYLLFIQKMVEDIYTQIDKIIPTLHGWCPPEKAKKMVEIITTQSSPLCVELGVFAGRSLLPIAWGCKLSGGRTIGIDPWAPSSSLEGHNSPENNTWWNKIDYEFFYTYTCKLMETHNVKDIVTIYRQTSRDAIGHFDDQSIDFLHQDGNHSEEVTMEEVTTWLPKLKKGGYWVFDDANWETTKSAQIYLETHGLDCIFTAENSMWKIYKKVV
jgi:hypothetical protein